MPDIERLDLDYYINTGDIRENLFNWYDFKENSNILFIGSDVYKCIQNSTNKVTILEEDVELYKKLTENGIEAQNTTLVDFLKCSPNKYDYIVVSSALKRIGKFVNKKNRKEAFDEFLKLSSELLSKDGIILLPIENKFSIRNFSGATFENNASYDIISGKVKNSAVFSKKEIMQLIEKSGYKYTRFFYPFPDHKLPSVIYSDEYLPNGNNSKLYYLLYFNPKDTIIFNELEVIREISKEGMLDFFANSYLIEISNSNENLSKVKFASYNNFRTKDIKLITKMYKDYVEKTPIYEEGISHIKVIEKNIEILNKCNIAINDRIENGKVISPFQSLPTLSEKLGELIEEEKIDEVKKVIRNWYKYVNSSFMCIFCEKASENPTVFTKYDIIVDEKMKSNMNFLKFGLFDFIFENIFVKLDENLEFEEIIAYDQEWQEENLPVEFILYRALNSLYLHNSKISRYVKIEEFYEEYNIAQFKEVFDTLEERIQEKLIDKEISTAYEKSYASLTTIEGLNSLIDSEKQKYDNLLEQTKKANESWQHETDIAYEKLDAATQELEKYRSRDLIYKLKNRNKK